MSDNVVITVTMVADRTIEFIQHADTSLFYLADFQPYRTRSFLLMMLHEKASFRSPQHPLNSSITEAWKSLGDVQWHRRNVGKYVEWMEVLRCEQFVTSDADESALRAELEANPADALDLLQAPTHRERLPISDVDGDFQLGSRNSAVLHRLPAQC